MIDAGVVIVMSWAVVEGDCRKRDCDLSFTCAGATRDGRTIARDATTITSIPRDSINGHHTMFGALNRFISRLDADPSDQSAGNSSRGGYGFQVLRNSASDLPLEPWFDFIVGINGRIIVGISSELLVCSSD